MVRKDPYRNFNFLVEIDGIIQAGFSDCSGLDASTDPIEYREGGENATVRKLPGLLKCTSITLKRGLADSSGFSDWYRQAVRGDVQRKNGSIIVLDVSGHEELRWNFFNAWPAKWEGPGFSAKGKDIAIETLVLAHEGIERA